MSRKYEFFLKDILESIQKIEEFVEGMEFDEFPKDDKTASAVVRKFEIIGEAVKIMPKEIKEKYPDVPWHEMAKMRDKVIHHYFAVDYEILWKTIKESLPDLKKQIKKIVKELEKDNSIA